MLQNSKNWSRRDRVEYSELNKLTQKKTRQDVRKINSRMTKPIIEETNSAKKANKFLLQGSKSIIAIQREDGTITNSNTETSNLATNFYRSLYESRIEVAPCEHQA